MRYDLDLLNGYCREIGLVARIADQSTLEVSLGNGAILCFQNAESEDDSLIGFLGTPSHAHGDIMFVGHEGRYIELDALNLLSGLKDGTVLVSERHVGETLADRWLIHSEYNDEFQHILPDERIVIRRANAAGD
jgi:hypothetical protein